MSVLETWTRVEDIPKPVAPGSYKYGWRQRNARGIPTTRRTLGITSAVKTPLLSELTSRSDIRYGLDVIEPREQTPKTAPANPPLSQKPELQADQRDYMTVKLKSRGADGKISYILINEGRPSKTYLDFTRLHPYSWEATADGIKLPPVSPRSAKKSLSLKRDLTMFDLNPNGYGLRHKKQTPKELTRKGKSAPADLAGSSVHKVKDKEEDTFWMRFSVAEEEGEARAKLKTASSSRPLLSRGRTQASFIEDTAKEAELNVLSVKPEGSGGEESPLYTRVKQSIHFIKKLEKGESVEPVPRLRPLQTEKVRYRPHSRAMAGPVTPEIQSPTKNPKSSEVYVRMLQSQQLRILREKNRFQSNTSLASADIDAMMAHYSQSANHTQRTAGSEQQQPGGGQVEGSKGGSSGGQMEIPAWAKHETGLEDGSMPAQDTAGGSASTRNSMRVDLPKHQTEAGVKEGRPVGESPRHGRPVGESPGQIALLESREEGREEDAKTMESSVTGN